MATQMKSALKNLASVSQSLNQVSDELATQLVEIEKAINGYGLGVTAWVTIRITEIESEVGQMPWSAMDELRYAKLEGKWGLVWVSYVAEDPENTWREKFLRESPRDIRLLAVKKLPELITELAKKAAEVCSDATERVREAREISAALTEQSSTEGLRF
jgi:hypothetical protein